MVSYAVPALKYALKSIEDDQPIPFSPDHFDSRPIATEKVRANTKSYKSTLSRHIFLSTFSYFEAYFHDLLKEILEYHGTEKLIDSISIDHNEKLNDPESLKEKRKLQKYPIPRDKDRYISYGRKLQKKGYRFPSTLLSSYGLKQLLDLINGTYIPAANIPELTESVLQLQLDEKTEVKTFHNYREIRNRIAHGRAGASDLHLKKAIEANNFLRNLALKIDKHAIDFFFIVESLGDE